MWSKGGVIRTRILPFSNQFLLRALNRTGSLPHASERAFGHLIGDVHRGRIIPFKYAAMRKVLFHHLDRVFLTNLWPLWDVLIFHAVHTAMFFVSTHKLLFRPCVLMETVFKWTRNGGFFANGFQIFKKKRNCVVMWIVKTTFWKGGWRSPTTN